MDAQNAKSSRLGILNHPLLLLLLGTSASLYLRYFRFPLTPVWVRFDQFGFILLSSRFWGGETYYRDFSYVTTPGHEMIHLFFFRLFGQRNWIPNADTVLVGIALTWLVAIIGRKMIKTDRFLSLLPAVLFLAFGFTSMMEDSHRWFSTAASLAALGVVMEERTLRRLAIAGGLCGVASFFTQTQGVFAIAGLATFLLWEGHIRKPGWQKTAWQAVCLVTAFLVTVIVTDGYFVWKAGFDAFWDSTVRYPAIYFPLDRAGGSWQAYFSDIPRGVTLVHLPGVMGTYWLIHVLVPFIYLAVLVWYKLRGTQDGEGIRVMLVNIMGLFFFAGIASSPSSFRLNTVSAPAMVLLVYFLQKERRLQRTAVVLLSIAALFTLVHRPIVVQTSPVKILQLPRGPIAFTDKDVFGYQVLDWLSVRTQPGDSFFTTSEPGIFFPLALKPVDKATTYDEMGDTQPEDVQSGIADLERYHVRFVQWPPGACDPEYYRPEEDHLGPLRKYLELNYRQVKRFDDPESGEELDILQRRE